MTHEQEGPTRSRTAWVLIVIAAAIVLAAVAVPAVFPGRREALVGTAVSPVVVVLSHERGDRLSVEQRAALAAHLQRESGLRVDVRVARSDLDAIEGLSGASRKC